MKKFIQKLFNLADKNDLNISHVQLNNEMASRVATDSMLGSQINQLFVRVAVLEQQIANKA